VQQSSDRPAFSLRLRLLLVASLVLFLALSLVGWAVDRAFDESVRVSVQDRLENSIYLVLAGIEVEDGNPGLTEALSDTRLEQPGSGLYAGILSELGSWESRSLLGVTNGPEARPVERGDATFEGPEEAAGWFVASMGLGWELSSGEILDITVWAAESPEIYEDSIASFRASLWQWLGLAAVVVIAAQILVLGLALRPLHRVAREVRRIESGERESIQGRYPRELQPLTGNLNALLQTERGNAQRYVRALGDLAHALKTPLAVLRAELESRDADTRERLSGPVHDMEHLVSHQLDKAARSTRRTMYRPMDVEEPVARLLASFEKLHGRRGVQFESRIEPGLTILMEERELLELLGNLVENAAKYGRGKVCVEMFQGAGGNLHPGVEIRVSDNGPGIDPDRFPDLLQRGVRGDERVEGHGLGLAIISDIVQSHEGQLLLDRSEYGGAMIRVILPPR